MAPRIKQADRKHVLMENEQIPVYPEDVARRLQEGESPASLAAETRVSEGHLRQWLARNGYRAVKQTTWQQADAG